ncbi:MAG TPA: carbohydrate porin [Terrimicrobiaceae bacterium]
MCAPFRPARRAVGFRNPRRRDRWRAGPRPCASASEGGVNPDYEIVIEATYRAQITPWLVLQPDLQYIIHPGGTRDYGNALILGGRVAVTF